jgi:hypothetical protein
MKPKSRKELSPFERFEHFAKALVSVPRKELQDKLEKHKREKHKKRK